MVIDFPAMAPDVEYTARSCNAVEHCSPEGIPAEIMPDGGRLKLREACDPPDVGPPMIVGMQRGRRLIRFVNRERITTHGAGVPVSRILHKVRVNWCIGATGIAETRNRPAGDILQHCL